MKLINFFALAVGALLPVAGSSNQLLLDNVTVYIECKVRLDKGGERSTQGSGVLVSADGKVLTAKHVIPEGNGVVCEGVIGDAFSPRSRMIIRKRSNAYDAALLQFSNPGKKFDYLKYCELNDSFRKATIFATGFPLETMSGTPSSRVGVLSTVLAGPTGLIETDSATTRGMSGGMVTLGNSSHLVGIIAGTEFDPVYGAEVFWGVLPVEMVANEFGLSKKEGSCIRTSKLSEKFEWHSGMSPLELGVTANEGICFLVDVWGDFNHEKDKVVVEVNGEGEFILTGDKEAGGRHGGGARCIWF